MGGFHSPQAGVVLLISLVFLLVLTLAGLSAMQGAISQERVAGSILQRNQSFQAAESGLRLGEAAVQAPGFGLRPCQAIVMCAPPSEAFSVVGPGANPVSAITWQGMQDGVYGIQHLGPGTGLANLPGDTSATLYRVTAVGLKGPSRTVLESVFVRLEDESGFRRILWRQLQ